MGLKHAFLLTPLAVGLAVFFVTPHPVFGQDHDLVMRPPVSATPDLLERGCPNSLSARFRINGALDSDILSHQVKIRFHYSDGSAGPPASPSSAWTSIGELIVTYTPTDGPFAIGRTWPDDFASAAGAAFSWRPPSSPTSFHVRAEVAYLDPAVVDANPGDNSTVSFFNSVPGSCPVVPPRCTRVAGRNLYICFESFDLIDPRIVRCLWDPSKPCWPLEPFPPICKLLPCPPCLTGLTCPPDPFELLFDSRANDLRIILVAQEGKEVARMERLRRPIRVGRQTFNQRLQFAPERGVSYYLKVLPGEKTRMDAGHELKLHLRGGRPPMGKKGRY
jgi:hypothetical protein